MPSNKSDFIFIKTLKKDTVILLTGWSTHEDPNDLNIIKNSPQLSKNIWKDI